MSARTNLRTAPQTASRLILTSTALSQSHTILCYILAQILGPDGDAEGRQSPGVYCTSLGRLKGIEPARVCDGWRLQWKLAQSLDRLPIWAGRERQRPGGDKSGRRPTAFITTTSKSTLIIYEPCCNISAYSQRLQLPNLQDSKKILPKHHFFVISRNFFTQELVKLRHYFFKLEILRIFAPC